MRGLEVPTLEVRFPCISVREYEKILEGETDPIGTSGLQMHSREVIQFLCLVGGESCSGS
jgi:hypothetical protein